MATLKQIIAGKNLRVERAIAVCKCHDIKKNAEPCMQFYMKVISDAGETIMSECTKKCVYMCAQADPVFSEMDFNAEGFASLKMLPYINEIVNGKIQKNLQLEVQSWISTNCNSKGCFSYTSIECYIDGGVDLGIALEDCVVSVPMVKNLATTLNNLQSAIKDKIRKLSSGDIGTSECSTIESHCKILRNLQNYC